MSVLFFLQFSEKYLLKCVRKCKIFWRLEILKLSTLILVQSLHLASLFLYIFGLTLIKYYKFIFSICVMISLYGEPLVTSSSYSFLVYSNFKSKALANVGNVKRNPIRFESPHFKFISLCTSLIDKSALEVVPFANFAFEKGSLYTKSIQYLPNSPRQTGLVVLLIFSPKF